MFDDFVDLQSRWTQTCIGPGTLTTYDSVLRMALPGVQQGVYADAQIDDYGKRARAAFPWKPPLSMTARARSSLPAATTTSVPENANMLRGTAGFGFWNYPFSVRGDILMLPEAVWFFYASPPSNMALVPGVRGWGWKAQVIHAMRAEALLATIPAALTTGWARLSGNIQPASRWLQRVSGAKESILEADMTVWHDYRLEWHEREAIFWVDNQCVLRATLPPTRPLGFVAWLDNQYAIASPQGILRFGTVTTEPEWFELDALRIEALH
jgi:hypothetical protein